MSDQQPQDPAPKRRAGSINRYTTLGNARMRERSDSQTSESPGSQTPEGPNVDTSKRSDVPTPQRIDVETPRSAHVQEEERPGIQEEKRSVTRTPNKRERHTIYLPPDLSEWVKIRAVKTKREISEIVTEAVERYRQQEEDS